MTGNVLIDLAISFIGITILVGLARLIFPNAGADIFSAAAVRDRLAFDEPDFEIDALLVDAERSAALAINKTGDLALVKKAGDGLVTRRARPGDLQCDRNGADLSLTVPDHTFHGFAIRAANDSDAQQWAVRIAGGGAI